MVKLKHILFIMLVIGLAYDVHASTFFFPAINPTVSYLDAPKWLRDGHGEDGYVTITSEVIPTSSCVPLSNHSFWGGEKTQLVLSIDTNGFHKQFNDAEIPIATFDGRDTGAECASLSTLPINVVPPALLGSSSLFNPGSLNLTLNVKSTSDSNHDFIGSAKLLLGAAAMVMTGGVGATIGGISATVNNPVLYETQTRTNNLLKGMVNGKTPITLTWSKLRKGIQTIEIPVYRAEGDLGSTPDNKIQSLQTDSKAERIRLFTVKLTFSYTNNQFDPVATSAEDLQNNEAISTSNVLNHLKLNGGQDFMQLLNDTSPSLLMTIASAHGHELADACSTGFEKLKANALSNIDKAIVMKSFIDEAKGGASWYNDPVLVKQCFGQAPNVEAALEQIYGPSVPQFVIGDVQEGIGKAYRQWRANIGPNLSAFRDTILARSDRKNSLLAFNDKRDIQLNFSNNMQPWQAPATGDANSGIDILAGRDFRTLGCFIYKDSDNLSVDHPGAYFILEDASEQFWVGNAKLIGDGKGKIASIAISVLSADWANYFSSYKYPGGDCAEILLRYNKMAKAAADAALMIQPTLAPESLATPATPGAVTPLQKTPVPTLPK